VQDNTQALIILRGLPGSGKSTLAALLSEQGKYPVCSIDDYFTDPSSGEYNFDFRLNHLAYKACEDHVQQMMDLGHEKIIVDNTFTLEWEMEPYFQLAAKNAYAVFVLTVENRHGGENLHGISEEQIVKMAAKYKVILHPFSL
jgi:predicted kinase